MNKKPLIICIAGESGSGKSLAAEYIEQEYKIPMIQSYTDRLPRYEGENGHTFVTKEQFDAFKEEDMIAFTNFGDRRYCCLHRDVLPANTYVIDEKGIDWLQGEYSGLYDIVTVRVSRDYNLRLEQIDKERLDRDAKMFYKPLSDYDYNMTNNFTINAFKDDLDMVLLNILSSYVNK